MDSSRNQEALSEHSRVSSSSSHQSSNYELIPKNQPIFKPKQDPPSSKLSNPFKKISNKSEPKHEQLSSIIKQKQSQILQLRNSLDRLREDYELQSKANEIYSQSFSRMKQLMRNYLVDDESLTIQQSIDKIFDVLKNKIQKMEQHQFKINQLKEQLLKSTQNNINAIFQHKFNQKQCVHLQLQNAEQQIKSLVTGYQSLKSEYSKLDIAMKQINTHASNQHQISFQTLKRDITQSIKQQLQQTKSTITRPSSNHEQVAIAKSLETKLNDLINTLYAPEKPTIQPRQQEQRSPDVKDPRDVELMRRIGQLQMKNSKLQKQIWIITQQRNYLQEKIMKLSKIKQLNTKQFVNHQPQFRAKNMQNKNKINILNVNRKDEHYEEVILTSRSDRDQQKIIQQLSPGESHINVFYLPNPNKSLSGQNRHQNSFSHHQSNSKQTQIQALHGKIATYQQKLKQKQVRIVELQNTILDHIEYKPDHQFPHEKDIRERYQTYINNLKVLLNESRKEYQILKKEFIKINQMNISRIDNQDVRSISMTVSDKTTKNNIAKIAQTRLIQRKPINNNSYETIKAKLQVQQLIQKAFFNLLDLVQKVLLYQEIQRQSALQTFIGCLKQLLLELKERNCLILSQISKNEEMKGRLNKLGIQLL